MGNIMTSYNVYRNLNTINENQHLNFVFLPSNSHTNIQMSVIHYLQQILNKYINKYKGQHYYIKYDNTHTNIEMCIRDRSFCFHCTTR